MSGKICHARNVKSPFDTWTQVPPCVLRGQCARESCRPYFHGLLHSKGGRWVKFKQQQNTAKTKSIFRGWQQSGGKGEPWGSRGGRLQAERPSSGGIICF